MQAFGKYQLISRVGAGGMAEVFLARSFGAEGLEKQVVIKRIRPEYAQQPRFVSMFIDEAKIAVSLNHPNVAQVYEFGRVGEDFYLAMEYVDGHDLGQLVAAAGRAGTPVPVADAVYIAIEVAKALDYAHRKQDAYGRALEIVHRDVSPQNVLISRDGSVKLVDFGIAKAAGQTQLETELKGKYSYMSPEQARGKPVDGRSDLFSLGIVLWEMLAGESLFPYQGTGKDTLSLVKRADIADIRRRRPEVDQELSQIIHTALSRAPDQRHDTARDLQIALTRSLFATGTIADSVTLATFLSSLRPTLEAAARDKGEATAMVAAEETVAPNITHTPSAVRDTGERLLDEIVEETGVSGGVITEVPDDGDARESSRHTVLPGQTLKPSTLSDSTVRHSERKEVVLVCGDLRGFATMRGETSYERWQQVLMDFIRIVESIAYKNDAVIDRLGEQGFTLGLGLPLSSENDAERAIAMSRDLVEAIEAMNINLETPLHLSVGVIVGSAVIEQDYVGEQRGGRFDWSYDDQEAGRGGLYLAESLAREAMAREILVGGRILRRISRVFKTEPIKTLQVELEDRDVALSAHRLLGIKSGREKVRELRHNFQGLFGRDLALKNLRQSYRQSRLTGRSNGLLIIGEQGVGKSTLVQEFLSGLNKGIGRASDLLIIRGMAGLTDKDTAYGSLSSLILEVLRLRRGVDLRVARRALDTVRDRLLRHLPELDQRFVVHTLAFLLGVNVQRNVVEQLEHAARREALYRSMKLFLKSMAAHKPVLFALEDIHNVDSATLGFLVDLMRDGLDAPLFMLMTSLPLPDEGSWLNLRNSTFLNVETLGELGPREARALTEALIPERLSKDDALLDAITARAGGNPLYIKELVELIDERGVADTREITLQLEAPDENTTWMPSTVEGLINSRIDRLSPNPRKTLQRCGVFGLTFGEGLVRAVLSDLDGAEGGPSLIDHLDTLVTKGFLRRLDAEGRQEAPSTLSVDSALEGQDDASVDEDAAAASEEPEAGSTPMRRRRDRTRYTDTLMGLNDTTFKERTWTFANSVTQAVAARGIVEPELGLLHERIADHLLDQGGDLFKREVIIIAHHLDAAGQIEQAGEMYLMAAHQAVDSVGGDECLRLVDKALARIDPFDNHYRSALDLKERALALLGRPEERKQILEDLLEMAETDGRRLRVLSRILRLRYELGELDDVETMGLDVLKEARDAEIRQSVGSALRLLHMVYRDTGRHQKALEVADEAITVFREAGDTEGLWAALVSKGITLRQGGRLNDALEAYQQALAIIQDQGFKRQEQTTLVNLGLLYANLGSLDQARKNYERALFEVRALGYVRDEAAVLANLGHLHQLYGDYPLAHRTLTHAIKLARRSRDKMALADALITLSFVHRLRDRLREAASLLDKGLKLAQELSNVYLTLHARLSMVQVQLALDSPESLDEAQKHAVEAHTLASNSGLVWARARALSLKAEVHSRRGESEEALRLSLEAVDLVGEQIFEGAEQILAGHARIAKETKPRSAKQARKLARDMVRATGQRIADSAQRRRYLASAHVRQVLDV